MLEDRYYMRPDYRPGGSLRFAMPAYLMLIISLVVVFALQQINQAYLHFPIEQYLALSSAGLARGYVWQLLTFQFLHYDTLHILFNLIGIWFFGRFIEDRLGSKHFLKIYFFSGIAGGLLQGLLGFIFPFPFGIPTVGASAGALGLVAAFTQIEPDGEILMFFVLPLRAKYLLYLELGIALFFTIVPSEPGIAHAAHLGGILFAVAYVRWDRTTFRLWPEWKPFRRRMRVEQMARAAAIRKPLAKLRRGTAIEDIPEPGAEEFISQQVDPILDKISAHGIQSLTDRERQILQSARNKMSKR